MDDGANRKLCDAMARRTFKVTAKVSTVVSMGDKVGTAYNDTCRNSVYVPGSTIPYTQTSNPEVKAFRDAFARYQPGKPVHQWALEAWLQGQLVAEALNKMGGGAHPQGPRGLPERPLQVDRQRHPHRPRLEAGQLGQHDGGLHHDRPLAGQQGRLGAGDAEVPVLLPRRQGVRLPRPRTGQLNRSGRLSRWR